MILSDGPARWRTDTPGGQTTFRREFIKFRIRPQLGEGSESCRPTDTCIIAIAGSKGELITDCSIHVASSSYGSHGPVCRAKPAHKSAPQGDDCLACPKFKLAWGHTTVKSGMRMLTHVFKSNPILSRGLVTALPGSSLEQSGGDKVLSVMSKWFA